MQIIIHGGGGRMRSMGAGREQQYRDGLRAACLAGAAILKQGGSALEASIAANVWMEDSGIFNAGLGSCLTYDGEVEMDAAIMEKGRRFGAVASVSGVRNPVLLAQAVIENTPHTLLAGPGATEFARKQGMEFREDFPAAIRKKTWGARREELDSGRLEEGLAALGGVLGTQDEGEEIAALRQANEPVTEGDTVGAVARDRHGDCAGAVSTGGIWMKLPGRVGDCPLPGAGIWVAPNGDGAAVATGTGESLMRTLISREVVDRMAQGSAQAACESAIALLESEIGPGQGGVIGVSSRGFGWALNTRGMGRAVWADGMDEPAVAIWPDEGWDRPVPLG
jgi:L-asparaginase / beta-aspartyl-peptidase